MLYFDKNLNKFLARFPNKIMLTNKVIDIGIRFYHIEFLYEDYFYSLNVVSDGYRPLGRIREFDLITDCYRGIANEDSMTSYEQYFLGALQRFQSKEAYIKGRNELPKKEDLVEMIEKRCRNLASRIVNTRYKEYVCLDCGVSFLPTPVLSLTYSFKGNTERPLFLFLHDPILHSNGDKDFEVFINKCLGGGNITWIKNQI